MEARIDRPWEHIFKDELSAIQEDSMREWVVRMLHTDVELKHKTEPASSTGKYHPVFAQGEGGLVRHTKAVVWLTIDMLRARPDLVNDTFTEDVYIAAAILHDMAKYHDNSVYTQFDHPAEMAARCLQEGKDAVAYLIGPHMGRWNSSSRDRTQLETPKTEHQWLLHYADYIASRTWIQMQFDEADTLIK